MQKNRFSRCAILTFCLMLVLTASAWGDNGETSSDPVALVNGVATGIVLEADRSHEYYLDVPEGAAELTVNLILAEGATAILYTRFGEQPTQESYECVSSIGGDAESCTHLDPSAGRWYIRVRTILAGPATITATYYPVDGGGALPLFKNEQKDLVLSEGSEDLFFFDVPEGSTELVTELNVASGQGRLYARFGQAPTVDNFDWASEPIGPGPETAFRKQSQDDTRDSYAHYSSTPENQARCELADPTDGRYYFMVLGLSEGESTIKADYVISDDDDGNGDDIDAGELVENRWNRIDFGYDEKLIFRIRVPTGATQFKVDMRTNFGEAILFTNYGYSPKLGDYDCSSTGQRGTVKCIHHFPEPGDWYILVYGISPGQVEIKPLVAGD